MAATRALSVLVFSASLANSSIASGPCRRATSRIPPTTRGRPPDHAEAIGGEGPIVPARWRVDPVNRAPKNMARAKRISEVAGCLRATKADAAWQSVRLFRGAAHLTLIVIAVLVVLENFSHGFDFKSAVGLFDHLLQIEVLNWKVIITVSDTVHGRRHNLPFPKLRGCPLCWPSRR